MPVKPRVAAGLQALADRTGWPLAAGNASEVAQQMDPAHLELVQVDESVSRTTITHDHALMFAQQLPGRHLAT